MCEDPDCDGLGTDLNSAANALSCGTHMAEGLAQKLYGCSIFDAFDIYFRTTKPSKVYSDNIQISKRVLTLPSITLRGFWGIAYLRSCTIKGSCLCEFEKQLQMSNGTTPVPVAIGPYGYVSTRLPQVSMMVVPKGTCSWCASPRTDSTMKCSCGCAYCCKDCQKQHWRLHKQTDH